MMDEKYMPMFTQPISDETAHALSEMLSWLSITFDNTYYAQIRRHHDELSGHRPDHPDDPQESN